MTIPDGFLPFRFGNFRAAAGAVFRARFYVADPAGVPYDMTGGTIRFRVKRQTREWDEPVIDLDSTGESVDVEIASGRIDIVIAANLTQGLRGVFDVRLDAEYPLGVSYALGSGTITIE